MVLEDHSGFTVLKLNESSNLDEFNPILSERVPLDSDEVWVQHKKRKEQNK